MFGIETRLLVAYGLIGFLVLAAAGLFWRSRWNSRRSQAKRANARQIERNRQRADTAAPGQN